MDPLIEARSLLELSREKLRSADYLLRSGFTSDAVSRAYYAAFNAARAVLLMLGSRARTHEGVAHEFGLRVIREGLGDRELGRTLNLLRQAREEGDYAPVFTVSREEAAELVERARSFVSWAERTVELLASGRRVGGEGSEGG